MGFNDLFKSRSSTTTLDPMLTKEQLQAQQMLSQLASTGSYGDINLGQGYSGSLGDFSQTPTETLAGNKLYDLVFSGAPQGFDTARNVYSNMANTKFNPDDPSSGYAAYARQVARAGQDSMNALNRDAAITGDRFSSALGRDKADLALRSNDMLASKLAELYNTSQNRALVGAQGLQGLGTAEEAINQGRIASGFQYGDLQRQLRNMEAQAKYKEFLRQREEKLKQIDIGSNLFNRNVNFGVMSKTTKAPSIFGQIYGEINPFMGSYNRAKYGADAAPGQSTLSDLVKLAMGFANPAGGFSSGGFGGGNFKYGGGI